MGVFDRDVEHSELGSICSGTISYEFYWLDRWYNVFRFHEPDGAFRNYYCNINLPPKFDGETLEYVDLDIDVLVWPDQRVEILDRDEFAENLATYGYPIDVITNVDAAVAELLAMIENREFPFEYPERSA